MPKKVKAATIHARAKRAGLKAWGGYDAQLKRQGGRCICGALPGTRRLHIDHDHKTGECRALVCWTCNATIGRSRDNAKRLLILSALLEDGWKAACYWRDNV